MERINPKELALVLYKLSMENSAMLQQTLMMQTEIMKFLRIIHAGSNKKFSDETANALETVTEQFRSRQVDFIENMLPIWETLSSEKMKEWVQSSMTTGNLAGDKSDYKDFAKLAKAEMVHTGGAS